MARSPVLPVLHNNANEGGRRPWCGFCLSVLIICQLLRGVKLDRIDLSIESEEGGDDRGIYKGHKTMC
jgi:hypothetical protein